MKWKSVKDELPEPGDYIVYCSRHRYISAVGFYWGNLDPLGPVPSCPDWLPWNIVTHWFKLDDIPE